jgi:hypothetical protein
MSDQDERCPTWGKAGFCGIKKEKMGKLCPYSCKKYARRRYIVRYAKPPKRRSPRPKRKPKPTKPTAPPPPPLTQDEKEDLKEATEEYAEEEETRLREKEEQRKEKDEEKVTPLQAPPVLWSENPSPIPAPVLDDLSIDVPSEYEGGTPPAAEKKETRYCYHLRIETRWSYSANFLPVSQARIFSGLVVKNRNFCILQAFCTELPTFCKMSADNTSPHEWEKFC